jgi:hypothetical protein
MEKNPQNEWYESLEMKIREFYHNNNYISCHIFSY